MARRNVYLPADLDEAVERYGLSLSSILQKALRDIIAEREAEEAIERMEASAEDPTIGWEAGEAMHGQWHDDWHVPPPVTDAEMADQWRAIRDGRG